jgi:hypothetical protein
MGGGTRLAGFQELKMFVGRWLPYGGLRGGNYRLDRRAAACDGFGSVPGRKLLGAGLRLSSLGGRRHTGHCRLLRARCAGVRRLGRAASVTELEN